MESSKACGIIIIIVLLKRTIHTNSYRPINKSLSSINSKCSRRPVIHHWNSQWQFKKMGFEVSFKAINCLRLFGSSLEVDSMLWQLQRGKYGRRTSRAQFQGLPGTVGHVAGPRVWVCRRSVGPSSRQVPSQVTSKSTLKVIRLEIGSQCSWRRSGVTWLNFLDLVIILAAAFLFEQAS